MLRRHGNQDLQTLAGRGGLSIHEIAAIMWTDEAMRKSYPEAFHLVTRSVVSFCCEQGMQELQTVLSDSPSLAAGLTTACSYLGHHCSYTEMGDTASQLFFRTAMRSLSEVVQRVVKIEGSSDNLHLYETCQRCRATGIVEGSVQTFHEKVECPACKGVRYVKRKET